MLINRIHRENSYFVVDIIENPRVFSVTEEHENDVYVNMLYTFVETVIK